MSLLSPKFPAKKALSDIAYNTYVLGSKVTDVFRTNQFSGKRCFIIGGGESLRDFDFSKLRGEITVGINKSFLYTQSTILYLSDLALYEEVHRIPEMLCAWLHYSGVKVMAAPQQENKRVDAFVVRRASGFVLPRGLEDGIICGNNSGFGALVLAHLLGCNPIYLLGYDMQCVNATHWHDGYKGQELAVQNKKMNAFRLPFQLFAPQFRMRGVRIINLNPDSALSCFPKKTIDEVI